MPLTNDLSNAAPCSQTVSRSKELKIHARLRALRSNTYLRGNDERDGAESEGEGKHKHAEPEQLNGSAPRHLKRQRHEHQRDSHERRASDEKGPPPNPSAHGR